MRVGLMGSSIIRMINPEVITCSYGILVLPKSEVVT